MKGPARHRFEKARMKMQEARGLERERFEYAFGDGSKELVMKQLAFFQNDDGGFGHGIEPDFLLPLSSPMSTWAAGQILLEVGADSDENMVQKMLGYLVNTASCDTGIWEAVIPEVNEFPHAPWWHWEENNQEKWMFNPGAELAAFLVHWGEEGSRHTSLGWICLERAVDYLMEKTEMDKHEIQNFQQMLKIMHPYAELFPGKVSFSHEQVADKVLYLAEKAIEKQPSRWSEGYVAMPLDFIDSPDHPLCEKLGKLIQENIRFYMEQMSDQGMWDVNWDWGSYPESASTARKHSQGILAVNRYKQLKAFGYLD
ncbi:hypothetical protein [Metabacillus lacus]